MIRCCRALDLQLGKRGAVPKSAAEVPSQPAPVAPCECERASWALSLNDFEDLEEAA